MGQINTKNLSAGLYKEAVNRSKDGNISTPDQNKLTEIARQGGINTDEEKFLSGLKVQNNVNTLKQASSEHEPQTVNFAAPSAANTRLQGATPRAVRNYEAMSPALQQKFNQVQDNTGVDRDLMQLLDKGTLTKKDSKGTTILENIHRMQSGPNQKGVNGKQLAEESIQVLNDRYHITQGPHGTCGAASLENVMMKKDPAEVTRIVTRLAADGKVTTRGGHTMHAGTGSLDWHKGDKTTDGSSESRTDFDIIFQSATMRSVALVGGDLDFVLGGAADYNVNKDNGDGSSVATGDSASDPIFLTALAEKITGKDYDRDHLWGTYSEMVTNANAGKEPIALFSTGGGGMHYVTVTSVKDGRVNFYDTAKYNRGDRANSMSVSDFQDKLMGTITVD